MHYFYVSSSKQLCDATCVCLLVSLCPSENRITFPYNKLIILLNLHCYLSWIWITRENKLCSVYDLFPGNICLNSWGIVHYTKVSEWVKGKCQLSSSTHLCLLRLGAQCSTQPPTPAPRLATPWGKETTPAKLFSIHILTRGHKCYHHPNAQY